MDEGEFHWLGLLTEDRNWAETNAKPNCSGDTNAPLVWALCLRPRTSKGLRETANTDQHYTTRVL